MINTHKNGRDIVDKFFRWTKTDFAAYCVLLKRQSTKDKQLRKNSWDNLYVKWSLKNFVFLYSNEWRKINTLHGHFLLPSQNTLGNSDFSALFIFFLLTGGLRREFSFMIKKPERQIIWLNWNQVQTAFGFPLFSGITCENLNLSENRDPHRKL